MRQNEDRAGNRDTWLKLEFAVLLIVLLALYFQTFRFAWDQISTWI